MLFLGFRCPISVAGSLPRAVGSAAAQRSTACQAPGGLPLPRRTARPISEPRSRQIHVAAHLAHAQSFFTDHLHDLQLEGRIEHAPRSLLCHLRSILVWEKVPIEVSVQIGPRHNILDIIQAELAPHMRRNARLRRRVLGLDKLLYCDIKAPLDPDFNPRMGYEEGCALILESLAPVGAEYVDYARQVVQQRWVDWADNVGKSSGGFCASPHGVHPYILITWSDTMRNVFTLAHELGHAGHFGLAMKHQRLSNMRPAMPFIEAPSIMNEMLLAQHILAGSQEPRLRRSVIMQRTMPIARGGSPYRARSCPHVHGLPAMTLRGSSGYRSRSRCGPLGCQRPSSSERVPARTHRHRPGEPFGGVAPRALLRSAAALEAAIAGKAVGLRAGTDFKMPGARQKRHFVSRGRRGALAQEAEAEQHGCDQAGHDTAALVMMFATSSPSLS